LLGAFQDSFTDWKDYNAEISDGKIVLSDSLGTSSKAFSISTDAIQLDMTSNRSIDTTQIPLVIDPWQRYSPGWGKLYNGIKENNSFRWGITGGITLQITSSAPISAYAFNDTYAMMSRPEDPNYDYSPGHYLPFPMAVVNIKNAIEYSVVLKIISNP
jgi:hypothetical protein